MFCDLCSWSAQVACYKEIYRVLKPGQCFAAYEWGMTDNFDHNNQIHQSIKAEIELGNGLPGIRTINQCLKALKLVGFEVWICMICRQIYSKLAN